MKDFKNREALAAYQLSQLNTLFSLLLPDNAFYTAKYSHHNIQPGIQFKNFQSFFEKIPFTIKSELSEDFRQHPPYGSNLTFPREEYIRYHQTSGTSGIPLRWLDTAESWRHLLENWQTIYRMSGVTNRDTILFAFSFGPFLGFWTAFEAAAAMGCLCIPGGGIGSLARLRLIQENPVSVLCCTPTYAIRLGEVAREAGIDLSKQSIKSIVVAGEPGGSLPGIYKKIEALWPGAKVYDHHGMTEVGPVSYECPEKRERLRIIGSAYLAEIIELDGDQPVSPGESGELVLTTLRRNASPLIRYRTGDIVREAVIPPGTSDNPDFALEGGILGRADDMLFIRGVNIFPSAIDEIIRQFDEVAEYQVNVSNVKGMEELDIRIEPAPDSHSSEGLARQLQNELQSLLNLRIPVVAVSAGTLPRFEMKAKRWIYE